jgi:hypothetical protein
MACHGTLLQKESNLEYLCRKSEGLRTHCVLNCCPSHAAAGVLDVKVYGLERNRFFTNEPSTSKRTDVMKKNKNRLATDVHESIGMTKEIVDPFFIDEPDPESGEGAKLKDLLPVRVQKVLKDATYPATREDLIDHAERQKADGLVLEFLRRLPELEYDSMSNVMNHYYEANRHPEAM